LIHACRALARSRCIILWVLRSVPPGTFPRRETAARQPLLQQCRGLRIRTWARVRTRYPLVKRQKSSRPAGEGGDDGPGHSERPGTACGECPRGGGRRLGQRRLGIPAPRCLAN
jgi:hypothetical protein